MTGFTEPDHEGTDHTAEADRIAAHGPALDFQREALAGLERSWRLNDKGCAQLALLDAIAWALLAVAKRPSPAPLVLPPDEETTFVRQLLAQAKAADAEYKVAAVRAAVYTFLHQYGRSELPTFKVAIDLAVSLRKIIDDLGSDEEESVRGGSYDVWGLDFGVEGGRA